MATNLAGEVHFIYFGLFINAVFILYGLYFINKEFKLIQFKKSHHNNKNG